MISYHAKKQAYLSTPPPLPPKKNNWTSKAGNHVLRQLGRHSPTKAVWSRLLSITQRRVNPSNVIKAARVKAAISNQELESK